MEQFLQTTDKKKVMIITATFLVIIGVLMVIAFQSSFGTAQNSQPNNPAQNIDRERDNIPNTEEDIPSFNSQPATKDYLNDYFALTYPGTWTVEPSEPYKGNIVVTFLPSKNPKGSYDPSVVISIDTRSQSITDRINPFLSSGYFVSNITVGQLKFIRIRGISPLRTVNGEFVEDPIQETYLYANNQGKTITIMYYADPETVSENDTVFTSILNSLTFF